MTWLLRGLRNGVLTTAYPARPDPYQRSFPAAVAVTDSGRRDDADAIADICPTGAIQAAPDGRLFLDRGRCVLCGACVRAHPEVFATQTLAALRADLASRVRRLRRSVHIRHVDAGSDGSDEWEVNALFNPVYDAHRLGIFLTASPRHADILLVTGAGARGMTQPLARTLEAMPRPLVVIAAGVDAIGGGMFTGSYATHAGVGDLLPVDVWAPGNPASPFTLLHAILLALGRVPADTGGPR
jgi:Ni,Fe-hydrogenase III small subunit/NAD-dependent dihydropyrimidine dehydrogenase PreA subunit